MLYDISRSNSLLTLCRHLWQNNAEVHTSKYNFQAYIHTYIYIYVHIKRHFCLCKFSNLWHFHNLERKKYSCTQKDTWRNAAFMLRITTLPYLCFFIPCDWYKILFPFINWLVSTLNILRHHSKLLTVTVHLLWWCWCSLNFRMFFVQV